MRALSLMAVCLQWLALASCTTPVVQADVTRFTVLPPPITANAGKSFTIIPLAAQVGSLEFQRYAELVAAELQNRGWQPIPPGQGKAETAVQVTWGAGAPHAEIWQSPSAVTGSVGWWGGPRSFSGTGVGMGVPYGDPFPYWETRSITYYPAWVAVSIQEARPQDGSHRQVLFEGRAVTERRSPEIARAIPALIRALFTQFPGADGATVNVTVPLVPEP